MTERTSPDYAALMKKALQRLEEMERKLRSYEEAAQEPIAVIGMACKFPSAANVDAFVRLLADGVDAISEVPAERWKLDEWFDADPAAKGRMAVRHGGFVDDAAMFDAQFFGISATEAEAMDPQQRMLLEVSWHAIEDAGLTRERLQRDRTGVFAGVSSNEYAALTVRGPVEELSMYAGVGNAQSVVAGRLAYFLGVNGPAMVLDTACSSSLVAVHLAVRSLRGGECGTAVVGGVNLLAAPPYTLNFFKAGMLARDGRCKPFDDAADGYVRGEGCGVVVLKRLSDAVRGGDRIHALIRGSAVNADGRTSGLTVPSGAAQQEVIRAALKDAGANAAEIQYVEAHGTGTALGDPIEIAALDAVYGKAEGRAERLRVGSVKSNIGHLEAAAGMASLIKVIVAMREKRIPRSLHFKKPNAHVDWAYLSVRVADEAQEWTENVRRAGISSFGFSGTNAHVVVESVPEASKPVADVTGDLRIRVSARSQEALRQLAAEYASRIGKENAVAICAAAYRHREVFPHRLTLAGADAVELREKLERFAETGERFAETDAAFEPSELDGGADVRVDLPLYPFQRSRYWLAHGWSAAKTESKEAATDLYRVEWAVRPVGCAGEPVDLEAAVTEELRQFAEEVNLPDMAGAVGQLEGLAAWYARENLRKVKFVLPKYQRLEQRLREIAGRAPETKPATPDMPEARLVKRCGERLADVLEGRADALEALFPQGDFAAVSAIYRESAGARLMNRTLAQLAKEAASRFDGKVRVLEAGAGTGSATASLLPALALSASEYCFTDVSQAFLNEARSEFGGYGFVRYHEFDLNKEPEAQGLTAGQFDLIVAANVVHATQDLRSTMGRLARLLVPGGVLLLQEGLRPFGWQDITFGLADGWWSFREDDLRSLHPLIGRREWLALAEDCGFVSASVMDWAVFGGDVAGQGVVVAKLPVTSKQESRVSVLMESKRGLADRIGAGGRVIVGTTQSGAVLREVEPDRWILDGADAAQVRRWIGEIRRSAGEIDMVAHLVGVGDSPYADQAQLCGSALHLAQAMGDVRYRLLIGTAGAVHAVSGDACAGHDSATLWGFGKVAALENPDVQVRLVDVDTWEDAAEALRAEWGNNDREQWVAWRRGRRYTARLKTAAEPERKKLRISGQGCYVITGAFGGLGMLTAEWLASEGAGELLLLGRGEPNVATVERVEKVRRGGTRVTTARVDVACAEDVSRVVRQCALPVRGVIHAAGTLKDAPIAQQDWAKFEKVLGPKVQGLWNLHEATLEYTLDFFVIFSSAVGLLGNAGQSNHAAASAVAEAFAWYRRSLGLPALAMDWGAWKDAGAAVKRQEEGHWALREIRGIAPQRGLELLASYLAAEDAHAVVLDMDWSAFQERLQQTPPHLREVFKADLRAAEQQTAMDEAADLGEYLQREVARLVGFPPSRVEMDIGLNELGVDSLMAVRLRNRLKADRGLDAPIVELMENPTIRSLAAALEGRTAMAVVEGAL